MLSVDNSCLSEDLTPNMSVIFWIYCVRLCLGSGLTPHTSDVVWLYRVSPFPEEEGDLTVKVAIDIFILKCPLPGH